MVFSNGIKIDFDHGNFTFHFTNINQRDELFEHFTSMKGLSIINFKHLIRDKYYKLQKNGKPQIDH